MTVPADPREPAPRHQVETELKLTGSTEQIEAAARDLRTLAVNRPTSTPVRTTYYDTLEQRLARSGAVFRVRSAKGRFEQTVKIERTSGKGAGLAVRGEWTWPLASERPDPNALTQRDVRARLPEGLTDAALVPLFATEFRRTRFDVPLKLNGVCSQAAAGSAARAEVAIDLGHVTAGDRTRPIQEIELELKAGKPSDLYTLARRLCADHGLRLGTQDKSRMGYQLVNATSHEAVKADRVALLPTLTAAETFRQIQRDGLRHLLSNDAPVVEAGDVEGIHQMRVALRRIRSAFSLFSPLVADPEASRLKDELKWLHGALGAARDWDVFVTETLPRHLSAGKADPARSPLAARAEEARIAARSDALAAVHSRRYADLVLALALWIEEDHWLKALGAESRAMAEMPMRELAGQWLGKRAKRVDKRGRKIKSLGDDARHELRIAIKKLRYAADFLETLYPEKTTRPFMKALSKLQTTLGTLNDVQVANALLDSLEPVDDSAEPDIARLRKRLAAYQDDKLKPLPDRWAAFRKAPRFWK